jgi:UDP-3-O-[3-hydroxymyristoyl] glucosamine N-acyltransferase
MEFTINQIAEIIGGSIEGDGNRKVSTIQPIEEATSEGITFLSNPKYEPFLYKTHAGAIIINRDLDLKNSVSNTLIRVDDPYSSFTTLLEAYQRLTSIEKTGTEQPSFVSTKASIGKDGYIGAFVYVGDGVAIGDHSKIYPNSYIGENVQIGSNCIIHPGVKLYPGTQIGNYCIIHAGSVIGSDGFGFAPQKDGTYKKIPQIGNVILEDHVEIGANTVIDSATFDSTIIKKGVKLDNLIQIAHNVEVDENTVIAAQTGISGSTKIGKNCVIGGQVGMVGHIKIADGTQIGAQTGISKGTKPGQKLRGTPAMDTLDFNRSSVVYRKLPEMMSRIESLEQKLIQLTSKHD